MSKAAMNLQDSFLNQVRRENSEVKVLLVNGTVLRGIVKGFDNFTLILNNRSGQHLIYKHAIAQLVSHRPAGQRREGEDHGASHESPGESGGDSESDSPAASAPANTQQSEQKQKSRKEGFNTLDLSNVKINER